MREGFKAVRPLQHRQEIEFCDKLGDTQHRDIRKFGEGAGVDNNGVIVAAVADLVDPGNSVPTPDCDVAVRGDESSIAQISGFMKVRLETRAGTVGKKLKALYSALSGTVAGRRIPKRTTIDNGKPFSENVHYTRDRDLVEQPVKEVVQDQ